MNTKFNRVAVVFDPSYGDRLGQLAQVSHVWANDSDENRAAADRYMNSLKSGGASQQEKRLRLNLTSLENLDAELLETLEDHHGEYAQDPPWNELEVIGRKLDPRTRRILEDWGFVRFEETPSGFVGIKG